MTFQQKNNLIGWLVFLTALIVYVLTIEPTLSLWDCGEFLVSAYKLEISHAPGAPLFMLLGRVFSLLSFGNLEKVALMVNLVSAVASAATVMFLFWTVVWLLQKIGSEQKWMTFLAAIVSSLAFAFSDSFWFSAVEAEVYALSMLFMALVLWAATRWEREADQAEANRWILLIFFFTGLSIGVHLLNLLVLPSVSLIIYFRKYKASIKGIVLILLGSGFLVLFLMKFFIPGIFSLAGPLELLAVNSLGFQVNTGFYFYLLLLVVAFAVLLYHSHKKNKKTLNLVTLCLVFLMLGYTSYMTSFIRSSVNPPVDQGDPETTFGLIDYLNRESYGSRPILYGENYGSVVKSYRERNTYEFDGEKYFPVKLNPTVFYEEGTTSFFPRLHSRDKEHMEAYGNWVSMKGKNIKLRAKDDTLVETTVPTFAENFQFFWRYQFGHMYLRYFMWNFVGRQNDIQGFGGPLNGNWQTGFHFLDEQRLGSQSELPSAMKENKARNSYFLLPLILGMIGLYYHFRKEKKTFFSLILLFAIMSIGLVVYLNEIPITPRERDYVFVGSFYVFCIWIGVGMISLWRIFKTRMNTSLAFALAGSIGVIAGPGILLQQNVDDHNRSGRYAARDLAKNYLECCEPNAILFTHADNDTYPLWYCQEVEGIRQDVRVVVMPYLNAGWYLRQINRKIYDNNAVKLSVPLQKYRSGELDYLPVIPKVKTEQAIKRVLDFVINDSSLTKVGLQSGEKINFIPVDEMSLQIGEQKIPVKINKNYLLRNDLVFWDILASNVNERPVYFTSFADPIQYGLQNYLRFDGLVFKLIPEFSDGNTTLDMGKVETGILYQNLMQKCNWENLKDSSVYFDWHHRRMFAVTHMRGAFYRLADALAREGQRSKAMEVIKEAEAVLPFNLWQADYYSVLLSQLYFKLGEQITGLRRVDEIRANLEQWLNYLSNFEGEKASWIAQEYSVKLSLYRVLTELAETHDPNLGKEMNEKIEVYLSTFKN